MELPKVFKKEPTAVEVEAGKTYAWCTCGLSEKNADSELVVMAAKMSRNTIIEV